MKIFVHFCVASNYPLAGLYATCPRSLQRNCNDSKSSREVRDLKHESIKGWLPMVSNDNNNNNNNNGIERCKFEIFISSLHRELSPTRMLKWPGRNRVQITINTLSAYHKEHAVCHMCNLTTSLRKCQILKPENSSANQDTNPHSSIGGRLGKQMC